MFRSYGNAYLQGTNLAEGMEGKREWVSVAQKQIYQVQRQKHQDILFALGSSHVLMRQLSPRSACIPPCGNRPY